MSIINKSKAYEVQFPENPVCEPVFPVLYASHALVRGYRPLALTGFHVPIETHDTDLIEYKEFVESLVIVPEMAERTLSAIDEYCLLLSGNNDIFLEPDVMGAGTAIMQEGFLWKIGFWVAASRLETDASMKYAQTGEIGMCDKYFLYASEAIETFVRSSEAKKGGANVTTLSQ